MAKFIFLDGVCNVNGVDLSDHAFAVDTPDEKEEVDVSGFNSTGANETLPGQRSQSIVIQFLQDFAASKVHATLEPLYTSGSAFAIVVKPTSATTSATNPRYWGTASLFTYNGLSGTRGQRTEITATFRPASGASFNWANS